MAEISWKITSIMGCGFLRKGSAENEQTPVNARSAGCRSSIDKIIVMKLCDGSGGILAENHSISSHKPSADGPQPSVFSTPKCLILLDFSAFLGSAAPNDHPIFKKYQQM